LSYQAEYIWIDGTEPTRKLRSKTKIVPNGKKPPMWGFDGSSTNQAIGHFSDCVLNPVWSCPDPLRGPSDVLVMCEVLNADMTPHVTNSRAAVVEVGKKYASFEPKFGIEQEYTFFQDGRPLGWPEEGFPAPQGPYYCGVGGTKMPGRDIVEAHTLACMRAGIGIEGTNAEVMMGQWEFQVGILSPVDVGDQLWVARWLLERIAEEFEVDVSPSRATGTARVRTPTFPRSRCAPTADGAPSSLDVKHSALVSKSTSRITASVLKSASPAPTRPRRGRSSPTASRTAGPPCASPGVSHVTRRDTSKTAGQTPTSIRTLLRG
jgi:hypothetical protein